MSQLQLLHQHKRVDVEADSSPPTPAPEAGGAGLAAQEEDEMQELLEDKDKEIEELTLRCHQLLLEKQKNAQRAMEAEARLRDVALSARQVALDQEEASSAHAPEPSKKRRSANASASGSGSESGSRTRSKRSSAEKEKTDDKAKTDYSLPATSTAEFGELAPAAGPVLSHVYAGGIGADVSLRSEDTVTANQDQKTEVEEDACTASASAPAPAEEDKRKRQQPPALPPPWAGETRAAAVWTRRMPAMGLLLCRTRHRSRSRRKRHASSLTPCRCQRTSPAILLPSCDALHAHVMLFTFALI